METFTEPKEFVENARYGEDRQNVLADLKLSTIDGPIVDLISGFSALPYCFPLQSCVGHFLCVAEQDMHTLDPIPAHHGGSVRYRIAYIALCIENSRRGRALWHSLRELPALDPANIQFGSADWFWECWVNSYALQVEPLSRMMKDEAILEVGEAHHIQKTRDLFFRELRRLLQRESRGGLRS